MGASISMSGAQAIAELKVVNNKMKRSIPQPVPLANNKQDPVQSAGMTTPKSNRPLVKHPGQNSSQIRKSALPQNRRNEPTVLKMKVVPMADEDDQSETDYDIGELFDHVGQGQLDRSSEKILSTEEVNEKTAAALQQVKENVKILVQTPPRDTNEQNSPFNVEFRKTLFRVTKSYFLLKVGVYPVDVVFKFRRDVATLLAQTGTIKLMCDVLSDSLQCRDFVSKDGDMVNVYWYPVKNILMSLLSHSDGSSDVRLIISKHQTLLTNMKQVARDWQTAHLQETLKTDQNKLLNWVLSIIHNCAMQEEVVPRLRDLDMISVLLPYLDSSMDLIRLSVISTLADIVNDEEAELLQTHQSIFAFIISKLQKALGNPDHKDGGWSALELMRAIKGIARNDTNKKLLVEQGALPLLVNAATVGNMTEQNEAISCMWALSFDDDNKKKMVNEPGLVELIHGMYLQGTKQEKNNKNESNNHSMHLGHACNGILWSLRDELCKTVQHKAKGEAVSQAQSKVTIKANVEPVVTPPGEKPIQVKGHVMMSYQWNNQEIIKRIVHELRSHGIPVWLDIDYMGGSTLQAMAKAVEDSFIVIIAMSQKYKDSPNTRAEAEYAFEQRKNIIPLIMQPGYRADGWLGLILGSRLYYDFSGKYSFRSRMDGLLKAIREHGGAGTADVNATDGKDDKLIVPSIATTYGKGPTTPVSPRLPPLVPLINETSIIDWTDQDKEKWLVPFKMEKSSMMALSGEEIIFLYNLKHEAPEYFYQCLEKKLCLSNLLDIARATKAIKELSSLTSV